MMRRSVKIIMERHNTIEGNDLQNTAQPKNNPDDQMFAENIDAMIEKMNHEMQIRDSVRQSIQLQRKDCTNSIKL